MLSLSALRGKFKDDIQIRVFQLVLYYNDDGGGDESRSGMMLQLRAIIVDALGTESYYKLEATVYPEVPDFSLLQTSIDTQLANGDTESMIQYFRAAALSSSSNASLSTPGVSSSPDLQAEEAAGIKQNLTRVIGHVMDGRQNRNYEDRVNLPMEMMSQVTGFDKKEHAKYLSQDVQSSVMDMLDTLIQEENLGELAMEHAIGALSNIAAAVAEEEEKDEEQGSEVGSDGEYENAAGSYNITKREHRVNASRTVTRLLSLVSDQLVSTLSVDEDAAVVSSPRADLLGRLCSVESTPGAVISSPSSSAVTVTVSPSLLINTSGTSEGDVGSSEAVAVKVSYLKSQPFPPPGSNKTGPVGEEVPGSPLNSLLVVEMSLGNRTIKVNNESEPFVLSIPYPSADENSNSPLVTHICEYWDEESQSWSTAGMKPRANNGSTAQSANASETLTCLTTHLTAFAVRINTFSAADAKAETFSYTNTVTLFMYGLLFVFIVASYLANRYDRKIAHKEGLTASRQFWRRNNKIIQERLVDPRSLPRLQSSIQWSVRRKHPWASIILRHRGDHITSTKRVVVLCVLLFNSMAVCALLCGQEQDIFFLSSSSSVAIVTTLMSFPIPYLTYLIISRSPPIQYKVAYDVQNRAELMQWMIWLLALFMNEFVNLSFDAGDDEDDAAEDDGNDGNDANDGQEEEQENEDHGDDSEDDSNNDEEEEKINGNTAMVAAAVGARGAAGISTTEGQRRRRRRRQMLELHRSRSCDFVSSKHKSYAHLQSLHDLRELEADSRLQKKRGCCSASMCNCKAVDPCEEDTHTWYRHDYIALTFATMVILGCFFIIAMLSYSLRDQYGRWTEATAQSFAYDFVSRFASILLFEMLLMAPFCTLCLHLRGTNTGNGDKMDSGEQQGQQASTPVVSVLRFSCGNNVGISYYKRRVVHIEKGSQAASLGVRRGWKIASVNGETVRNDTQCNKQIFTIQRTSEWLLIGFTTSPPSSASRGETSFEKNSTVLSQNDSMSLSGASKRTNAASSSQNIMDSLHPSARSEAIGLRVIDDEGKQILSGNSESTTFSQMERDDMQSDGDDDDSSTFSQMERDDIAAIVAASKDSKRDRKDDNDDDDDASSTFSQMERDDIAAIVAASKDSKRDRNNNDDDDDDASSTFSQMERDDVDTAVASSDILLSQCQIELSVGAKSTRKEKDTVLPNSVPEGGTNTIATCDNSRPHQGLPTKSPKKKELPSELKKSPYNLNHRPGKSRRKSILGRPTRKSQFKPVSVTSTKRKQLQSYSRRQKSNKPLTSNKKMPSVFQRLSMQVMKNKSKDDKSVGTQAVVSETRKRKGSGKNRGVKMSSKPASKDRRKSRGRSSNRKLYKI
eukprot:jgi/Bigna1/127683/aug1.5_g2391